MSYKVAVDIGGTFSDVVVIDENKGTLHMGKSLTTPSDYKQGVINGIKVVCSDLGTTIEKLLGETKMFCLGTTIATNAIMTRTGVKTGLITTRGFEDVIHMARGTSKWAGLPEADIKHVAATYKPEPVVPKELVQGVIERGDRDGDVVSTLDVNETKKQIRDLLDKKVDAIAVSLLWSVRNNKNEQEVAKLIKEMDPDMYVSVSSNIAPVVGEFERTITTVLDSYIGPITEKFLNELSKILKDNNLEPELLVMKADGGCTYVSEIKPIATTHSGPAGGVVSGQYIGNILGYDNVITSDVGGTTFDVSLIIDGRLLYSREPSIGRFNIAYPTIDMVSIGAGGGSIAWIDKELNALHVGPKSAGSNPGPICYGFGGKVPTVTDACLALGYLNRNYFLGGRMKLNYDGAMEALESLGKQIGMGLYEVSDGIWKIINAAMAELVKGETVRRGRDPRDFALLAFGGAGPLHAAWYASELGLKDVIIPVAAPTQSALGLAVSDILHTRMRPHFGLLTSDAEEFNYIFEGLENTINKDLDKDKVKKEDRVITYFLDMKYGLQYHTLRIPVKRKKYTSEDMELLAQEFDTIYENTYGKGSGFSEAGRYIINFIVQGIGKTHKVTLKAIGKGSKDASAAIKEKRDAYFNGKFMSTKIYDYYKLKEGNIIEGPAVIETKETTTVARPGQKCKIDKYGNILLTLS